MIAEQRNRAAGADLAFRFWGASALNGWVAKVWDPRFSTSTGAGNVASVGRVQTPTLAIVYAREQEIRNFKPRDYWRVTATSTNATLGLANPAAIAAGTSGNVVLTPGAATAGSLNSTLTLAFVSDARGISGLSDLTLASSTVAVTGAAYDLAQPAYSDAALAFGNVRPNTVRNIAVANALTGASATYQDKLAVAATRSNAKLSVANPAADITAGESGKGCAATRLGNIDPRPAASLSPSAPPPTCSKRQCRSFGSFARASSRSS